MPYNDEEDQRSFSSVQTLHPSADTVTQLIKRVRALAIRLLPVQVEMDEITDPTSRIITPGVVDAFNKAGGDFSEAVPFALLRARALFIREGIVSPADFDETQCRATACEVIARRLLRKSPDRLRSVLSERFRWRESDGDISGASCALELAVDGHCTIFLSSNETQEVVDALWKGALVQHNNANQDIDYVEYHMAPDAGGFWYHLDPARLAVPRYLSMFRIIVWLFYLFVYSQTVQSPLDAINPYRSFNGWEITLYVMTFAFLIDEVFRLFKTIRLAPNPMAAFNFWTVVSFLTEALLLTAFALRLAGMEHDGDSEERRMLHLRSFQVLSCAAPLMWVRLVTMFEGYKTVGVLQVVVFRMLRESAIFFILLGIMSVGFAQAMYALDAADGDTGDDNAGVTLLINSLLQAMLGSPDFEQAGERFGYPFGLIIFYSWNFVTTIILVNVLIALFGTAYSDVYDNATDEFLAFFAGKTIGMIRAPDTFVYPAPFNLIETFLIAPFEFILSPEAYVKLNRVVMTIIFFVPLCVIALYETAVHHKRSMLHQYFGHTAPEEEDDDPAVLDPRGNDPSGEITKVDFKELTESFPNTTVAESTVILSEVRKMRAALDEIEAKALKS